MIAFLRSRAGVVLLASLAVAGFFLVLEHRVHLSGFLPYALVALFIVFHLFMHRGHGGHSVDDGERVKPPKEGTR